MGIVFDTANNTQIINTEHDSNIISLSVHPAGHTGQKIFTVLCVTKHRILVATGELAAHAKIVIWDANTGITIVVIKYHTVGVSHVAFSSDGDLLVSVGECLLVTLEVILQLYCFLLGMDADMTLAVHNTSSGSLVGRGKIGRGVKVFSLSVGSNNSVVTGGINHIKFWDLPKATSPGGFVLLVYSIDV